MMYRFRLKLSVQPPQIPPRMLFFLYRCGNQAPAAEAASPASVLQALGRLGGGNLLSRTRRGSEVAGAGEERREEQQYPENGRRQDGEENHREGSIV